MEKEFRVGKFVFKVYDFLFFAFIMLLAILTAAVSGAMNLNISGDIPTTIMLVAIVLYILLIVKRRK